jgi:hypothetical protein
MYVYYVSISAHAFSVKTDEKYEVEVGAKGSSDRMVWKAKRNGQHLGFSTVLKQRYYRWLNSSVRIRPVESQQAYRRMTGQNNKTRLHSRFIRETSCCCNASFQRMSFENTNFHAFAASLFREKSR